jgi:hypothetical protein
MRQFVLGLFALALAAPLSPACREGPSAKRIVEPAKLIGQWKLNSGTTIAFYENGEVVGGIRGMDPLAERALSKGDQAPTWKGTWKREADTLTLQTTSHAYAVPEPNVLRIEELTAEKLVMVEVRSERRIVGSRLGDPGTPPPKVEP